jgi:hypothetical protein
MPYSFSSYVFNFEDEGDKSPEWRVELKVDDRNILGTDRFERTIHGGVWRYRGKIWLKPGTQEAQVYQGLKNAYRNGTISTFSDGKTVWRNVIVSDFRVVKLRQGNAGYAGEITFSCLGNPDDNVVV